MAERVDSYNPAWMLNWKREIEGIYLYQQLSNLAPTPELKKALAMMADQEATHAALWADLIQSSSPKARKPAPDLRIHMIIWLARWLGVKAVLGLLVHDEVGDIATYSVQAQESSDEATYRRVLSDETDHARALSALRAPGETDKSEPWHRSAEVGGWLRTVIYGFNDGLTANFGLVMGVVGASVRSTVILFAGLAGLLADALSMAASDYLAARSEQEVRQHELMLERTELWMMPKEERQELIQYFVVKGLTAEEATTVADRLMQKPDVALTQLAREELRIDPEAPSQPLREGVVTGIATGLGAIIPLVPFFFISGAAAVWLGIVISMLAHFVVGASRSILTGRPAIRSGLEMFLVGMGVALVTFVLGQFLSTGMSQLVP